VAKKTRTKQRKWLREGIKQLADAYRRLPDSGAYGVRERLNQRADELEGALLTLVQECSDVSCEMAEQRGIRLARRRVLQRVEGKF
jgi:hypothetical protein